MASIVEGSSGASGPDLGTSWAQFGYRRFLQHLRAPALQSVHPRSLGTWVSRGPLLMMCEVGPCPLWHSAGVSAAAAAPAGVVTFLFLRRHHGLDCAAPSSRASGLCAYSNLQSGFGHVRLFLPRWRGVPPGALRDMVESLPGDGGAALAALTGKNATQEGRGAPGNRSRSARCAENPFVARWPCVSWVATGLCSQSTTR